VQTIIKPEPMNDNIAERMKHMKDEYNKNFVDINFYGMQTKIQNPMSHPEWRNTFKQMNA
jgi:hypothetical protein